MLWIFFSHLPLKTSEQNEKENHIVRWLILRQHVCRSIFLGKHCNRHEWWAKYLLTLLGLGCNDLDLELQECELCASLISSTLFTSGEEGLSAKILLRKTKIIVQNDAIETSNSKSKYIVCYWMTDGGGAYQYVGEICHFENTYGSDKIWKY